MLMFYILNLLSKTWVVSRQTVRASWSSLGWEMALEWLAWPSPQDSQWWSRRQVSGVFDLKLSLLEVEGNLDMIFICTNEIYSLAPIKK